MEAYKGLSCNTVPYSLMKVCHCACTQGLSLPVYVGFRVDDHGPSLNDFS